MPRLFVPPRVAQELAEQTRQYGADLDLVCTVDETCRQWNKELERLDPYLRMVKAPDRPVLGLPLQPGHYHIIRDNPTAPPSVIPVRGPNGEFIEPPGMLLEQLKGMDLQNTQVHDMRRRIRESAERQEQRRKDLVREQRRDTVMEKWKAVSQASVSMNTDTPWHQNAAGKRGVKRPAEKA